MPVATGGYASLRIDGTVTARARVAAARMKRGNSHEDWQCQRILAAQQLVGAGMTATYDTAPRPAPKAEGATPLTVRFDPSESLEIDRWLLELRTQTGIRWDKAEIVRELLRMARTPDSILCDALAARARRVGT